MTQNKEEGSTHQQDIIINAEYYIIYSSCLNLLCFALLLYCDYDDNYMRNELCLIWSAIELIMTQNISDESRRHHSEFYWFFIDSFFYNHHRYAVRIVLMIIRLLHQRISVLQTCNHQVPATKTRESLFYYYYHYCFKN